MTFSAICLRIAFTLIIPDLSAGHRHPTVLTKLAGSLNTEPEQNSYSVMYLLYMLSFSFFFLFQFHVMTLTLTWRCGPKTKTSLCTLLFFFPALLDTRSNVQKALLDLCQVTSSCLQLVLSLESSSSFSRAANCPNVCTLTFSWLLFNSSNSSLTIKSKSIHLPLACRASFAWPQRPLLFTLLPLITSLLFRWLNMPCSRSPPFSSLDLDFSSITFACFTLSHSDGRGGGGDIF